MEHSTGGAIWVAMRFGHDFDTESVWYIGLEAAQQEGDAFARFNGAPHWQRSAASDGTVGERGVDLPRSRMACAIGVTYWHGDGTEERLGWHRPLRQASDTLVAIRQMYGPVPHTAVVLIPGAEPLLLDLEDAEDSGEGVSSRE
ncbi:hypothetical protein ACIBQ1_42640 [Nonomuraea sp. NPDC050153]|uniref:hypothetical protein n=1 Tax=Nonomuraea sp. NPDC050153 TaxID=3364359 RepID=UPI00379B1F72